MSALILTLSLCGSAIAAAQEVDLIRNLRMQSNDAIARHDADALKSFLHENYVISVSNGSIERSRDEHVRSFAGFFSRFADGLFIRTPEEIVISSAYPLAIEHGTWSGSRTGENGQLDNGGQYTAAWKKTADGWKIYSELFVALFCRGADCK